MRVFLDTSVMIAAFLESNPDHEGCRRLMLTCHLETAGCGAHSLAEFYSSLTRMPPPFQLRPEQEWHLLEEVRARVTPFALTAEDHFEVLRRAVESGIKGSAVYDDLLLGSARKQDPDRIYTLNVRHFQSIAPDLADRILIP